MEKPIVEDNNLVFGDFDIPFRIEDQATLLDEIISNNLPLYFIANQLVAIDNKNNLIYLLGEES